MLSEKGLDGLFGREVKLASSSTLGPNEVLLLTRQHFSFDPGHFVRRVQQAIPGQKRQFQGADRQVRALVIHRDGFVLVIDVSSQHARVASEAGLAR